MIELFKEEIQKFGKVTEENIGQYKTIKKGVIKFEIQSFVVENLGAFSITNMSAMFGLMKMKTLVFTPLNKDLPLLSYDLISVMKNRTLLLELYNTNIEEHSFEEMDKIKEEYSFIPDNELEKKWYDNLKLSPTLSKKSKTYEKEINELSIKWVKAYLDMIKNAKDANVEDKLSLTKNYVDGLFSNGGPSTDQFKKMIGDKEAYDLFSRYIFHSVL